LTSYAPSNSRSQLITSAHGNQIIADAYNANPSSMHTALDNFLHIEPLDRPRTVILGDMNELGESSHEAHQELYARLKAHTASPLTIYLCGPHWVEELGASDHVLPSVEELIARIEATPITDSLILVKGSNGIHLGRLLPSL
ncbi:MAG: UDP-N-acetylmuramoyl-tripeptide--D-alanyl-D-alanine ligase, partial [Porphyromonadaceae bacterium]|nr:UDP-N-acetylmuramoyl-tripeptide--D-alanyl-D-alanine ligase [Porphyromonadaceae bacterium]